MTIFYPTDDEQAREQKLPGWAQDIITTLRRGANIGAVDVSRLRDRVDELEVRLADRFAADTGPEDSTAWLWREDGGEGLPALGLGKEATVEFRPGSGIDMNVSVEGNGIIVDSHLHLMIVPIERTRFLIQPVSAKIKN
jgi:hypothetical protein